MLGAHSRIHLGLKAGLTRTGLTAGLTLLTQAQPVRPSLTLLSQACGTEGGRCCLGRSSDGFVAGTCGAGLTCIPGPTVFGSKAQYEKLSRGVAAAAADGSVSGTCRKATTCNTAYNPCGKAAGGFTT